MAIPINIISGYSLGVAALLSLFKWRKTSAEFLPFFILIWLGIANEVISLLSAKYFRTNAVNNNIYVLLEWWIILWQFKKWELFRKSQVYLVIGVCNSLIWIAEFWVIYSIKSFSSYFRIAYSFLVVLMSILMVNRLIVNEQRAILKNATFLICTGFILFFTYKVLVEIFWVYGLNASSGFRSKVYEILDYINIASNLIYAIAILWMPRKREFIQLS